MVQKLGDERRTAMGLGGQPEPEDGELVHDDELIGPSEPEHARPEPLPRYSSPRISQRLPRLDPNAGAVSEGDVLSGRYRVERIVSRSPREVVLEASHLELGQRVLLRHLTLLASTSPEAVARFQRGARKAREMRSEQAERVVDFGRLDGGLPFRASELPDGPSLAEIVRVRGALPVSEAVSIVLLACEPLAEAHAAGMVHRSVSTSNVFVERRPDGTPLVRVLDFGVSDPFEPDWVSGDESALPGASPSADALRFAAPEQIRNPRAVDARADVWAIGAILYELLAGGPLFLADNPLTLLAMITADSPTPLGLLRDDVPFELEQLVLACLEKEPDARPRSVVELVLGLAQYASPDAQATAARVARIVMRTTRPPPLSSDVPAMPSTAARTSRALVRSTPPPRTVDAFGARPHDARGFGMLFAGAAIGLGAALLALRLAPGQRAASQEAASEAAHVTRAGSRSTTSAGSATPAEATVGAARETASAEAAAVARPAALADAPPATARAEPPALRPVVSGPSSVPPSAVRRAPASPAAAAEPRSAASPREGRRARQATAAARGPSPKSRPTEEPPQNKATASADDLFGGLD